MRNMTAEVKVGLFAIVMLAVLAFMTLQVGGFRLAKPEGYLLHVYFDNSVGLDRDTKVRIAGVNVGVVEEVGLEQGRAKVLLRMNPGVVIGEDSTAAVRSIGLLGDKYVELTSGSTGARPLRDGEHIERTIQPTDYDALVANVSRMATRFAEMAEAITRVVGDDSTAGNVRESVANIREITEHLDRAILTNDRKMQALLDNLLAVSEKVGRLIDQESAPISDTIANVRDLSKVLNEKAPKTIDEITNAARDLRELIGQIRDPALTSIESLHRLSSDASATFETIRSVANRVEQGEGTIGKLVRDPSLYDNINKVASGIGKQVDKADSFRTFINVEGAYLSGIEDTKGSMDVRIQPAPDHYYLLGVVSDPLGNTRWKKTVTWKGGKKKTTKKETTVKDYEFNALISRTVRDVEFRVGLMENTFGLGASYRPGDGNLELFTDVWDFRKDEPFADNAHMKIGARYLFSDYFVLSAGYDNPLNAKSGGIYVGGGVRFEDEDLKYLMGGLSGFVR